MFYPKRIFFALLSLSVLLAGCAAPATTDVSSAPPLSSPVEIVESTSPIVASRAEPEPASSAPVPTMPSLSGGKVDLSALSTQEITWGPGVNKLPDGRPSAPVELQKKYGHLGAYFIGDSASSVYLTFDEGYENGYTPAILDTLRDKKVSAVFFVTMPYVKENPQLIRRSIAEGHILGNHSVNHKNMPTLDIETATNEILELHNYVKEQFSYEMWLFRPPAGTFSEQSLGVALNAGYRSVFWSFAYRDWVVDDQMPNAEALEKLQNNLYGGALYLLHAVSKTNTEILGEFIDNARADGLVFDSFATFPDTVS